MKVLVAKSFYHNGGFCLSEIRARSRIFQAKQAAACWLVELGNGDKFLFDIGSGSHERIAAQRIPYDFIDKVFLGHLHVDHFGDLGSFWIGG